MTANDTPDEESSDAVGGYGAKPRSAIGRKRDDTRDVAILDAAIAVLAETGYDRMTMDMVALRAKAGKATVYRRWASKADMVVDAVARMKRDQVDLENLPDTGNLRGDLLALFRPQPIEETERKLRAMAGMAAMLSQHPALSDTAHDALVAPWVEANLTLMRRAVARGEIAADADIATVAQVTPSMGAYRSLVQRLPFDREFLVSMLDGLVLPALGIKHPS